MYYYSYQTKTDDLKGGPAIFPGPEEPRRVEARVHVLVLDETKMSENLLKMLIEEMGETIEKSELARPVTPEEFEGLPHQIKDELQRLGYASRNVPFFGPAAGSFHNGFEQPPDRQSFRPAA
jgi:hypothetical protein